MSLYQYAGYTIFAGGVISWLVATKHFLVLGAELQRARKTGEASHIPLGHGGLPTVVLFTKNTLPRVENDRRKFVRALSFFAGF
ncbi:MAG TPA: hypothetical protein VEU06_01170 [Micropepsaceae bacterium]|nr:hypothetical protein [Micropepsaceae bacterium]